MSAVKMMRERLGADAHPIQIPMGEGDMFTGIIDIIRRKAMVWDDDSLGAKYIEQEIPAAYHETVEELRRTLVEATCRMCAAT